MQIDFGLNDHDISIEYTLQLRVLEHGPNDMNLTGLVFYDELPMTQSFNVEL